MPSRSRTARLFASGFVSCRFRFLSAAAMPAAATEPRCEPSPALPCQRVAMSSPPRIGVQPTSQSSCRNHSAAASAQVKPNQ